MSSESSQRGRVTLRTIAEEVGVDISTVSRTLRRRRSGHAAVTDTARRILDVADRLGYVRDEYAASLRTQRTAALGVLMPRLSDVVLADLYEVIEDTATEFGYQTVVANTRDDPQQQRRRIDLMLSRRVDGLILGDARLDSSLLDELAERDVPFVLVSRRAGDHVAVTIDDHLGGRLAATHLADLGHRRIGILAVLRYASTACDRRDGAVAALGERGIEVSPQQVAESPNSAAGGYQTALRLLTQDPGITALFAVNDFTAIGAMGAIRDLGLQVGRDVAVVGFHDTAVARELTIPLTSIRTPLAAMGATATTTLLARMAGEPVSSVRLAPELVVRESSDTSVGSAARRSRLGGPQAIRATAAPGQQRHGSASGRETSVR